ncbi:MAG: hypothetical protein KDA33_01875, partial [Phycisphaerales bacterium]|nr:hypothetical protein [Phycisphaerales bacterium]
MSARNRRRLHVSRLKSCLCLLLMMNTLGLHAGCGSGAAPTLGAGGRQVLPIDGTSVLGRALAGTTAARAKTLDVDLNAGMFRLIDRDGASLVSGHIEIVGARPIVTALTIHGELQDLTLELDASRRVTAMRAADDLEWRRGEGKAEVASERSTRSLLDANRDLLAIANELDSGKYDGAAEQSQVDPGLAGLLSLISALLTPIGGVLQPLLAIFSIMTAIEAMQPADPQIQMGVSGAYVIEFYLDPASPRRATLSEFDTDRSLPLLGPPDAATEHILLRSGGAVMHIVADGMGTFAGVRSGDTILILDGTAEQVIAWYANVNDGAFRTTGYLAYEVIDVLNYLQAQSRSGRASDSDCDPAMGGADVVAGFPIPAGSVFENIAAEASLGDDATFCTQLSIYSAVLLALDRDGFINSPQQPQRELVGWGSVAAEAGVCGSLFGPTQTCTEMMRSEDELLGDEASDDDVLLTTYGAVTTLLETLVAPVPARLESSLQIMAERSNPAQ